VAQLEGQWTALDWSGDEKTILALQTVSNPEHHIWTIDVATGAKTEISPKDAGQVRWAGARFSDGGKVIHALTTYGGDTARVWRYESGKWTAVTPGNMVIESFSIAPDGKTLAVVVDEGTRSRLQLLDAGGKPRNTPTFPPGQIADLLWHPDSQALGFSMRGGRGDFDVYTVHVPSAKPERWTFSENAASGASELPDAELVQWKSFDDLNISGVLYRAAPRFTGPRPVIINIHGGPVEVEKPRFLGRSNFFRNELGISIIYPNVRGSAGFGRKFEDLDNGKLRQDAVKDIGALLDWIARQPHLDKNRVMLVGASHGGYLALAAAAEYGDRVRCVQSAFALYDFVDFLETTVYSNRANRNVEYGDPDDAEMRAYLNSISPVTNAAKIKIPVYIAHGGKDTRIRLDQANRMVEALKKNGTPVWYDIYEEMGHLNLNPSLADYSIYTWTLFMQQYLLN
jgi:dipeptidyl aminopeptidase/acylaminoacyl peptidase